MTPRQRYLLDQAPGLVRVALDLESLDDDPLQCLKPSPDLPERAIVRAVALAEAIYDLVVGDDVGAAPRRDEAAANCPHQDIISLYHELLPVARRVRSWNGARAEHLRARWREHPDLEWWRDYFTYVGESAFLTGRTHAKDRRPFVADLEWLANAVNMARIYEGKYHGV